MLLWSTTSYVREVNDAQMHRARLERRDGDGWPFSKPARRRFTIDRLATNREHRSRLRSPPDHNHSAHALPLLWCRHSTDVYQQVYRRREGEGLGRGAGDGPQEAALTERGETKCVYVCMSHVWKHVACVALPPSQNRAGYKSTYIVVSTAPRTPRAVHRRYSCGIRSSMAWLSVCGQ